MKTTLLTILLLLPALLQAQGGFEPMLQEAVQGKYITSGDVGDLEDGELRLLRNAVYAQHGYIFKSEDLKKYFGAFAWYHPLHADVGALLSDTDVDNVNLVRMEERRRERPELQTPANINMEQTPANINMEQTPANIEMEQVPAIINTEQTPANINTERTPANTNTERTPASLTERERELLGMWHDGFAVGSGYGERYFFYPTRRVVWFANEMDCSKRLVAKLGVWHIEGSLLFISWMESEVFSGGRLVAVNGEGSCASDSVLVGGLFTINRMAQPEEVSMVVSPIEATDEMENNLDRISFDQLFFWRMCSDPFTCE